MFDKCTGIMGRIFGHNYELIITKGSPQYGAERVDVGGLNLLRLAEISRPQAYHGIYCKRCGKVVDAQ